MTILFGDDHELHFSWSSGNTGTMRLTWTPTAQVATLTIAFD
jgi:steroid delta-isomerase